MFEPTKDQISRDISFAYVETEAHVYAFAHALHAASDILAKVVCYALPSDCGTIELHKISLRTTAKALRAKHTNLVARIEELLASAEYNYLAAFTNQIKHHSVIGMTIPCEYDESSGAWRGLQMDDFVYLGTKYPARTLNELVTNGHNAIERGYIAIGCALNESHGANKAPEPTPGSVTPRAQDPKLK